MEGSLCNMNRYVDQAPEQVQDSRYSQVLLSGQGETPGQTVPLSVELFMVTTAGSSLLRWHSKAPKPPEMHLHSRQHPSLSGQTWFNISVTHPTLCPSLQLKKSKALFIMPSCGWLGAPKAWWPALTLAACTIMPTQYLQLSCASPTASCESANILPFYCLWRATRREGFCLCAEPVLAYEAYLTSKGQLCSVPSLKSRAGE